MAGIGPATSPLPRECSTTEPHGRVPAGLRGSRCAAPGLPAEWGTRRAARRPGGAWQGGTRGSMERETGIEPAPSAWKAEVLPLNYSRDCNPLARTAPAGVALSSRCCLLTPFPAAFPLPLPTAAAYLSAGRRPPKSCVNLQSFPASRAPRPMARMFSGFHPGGGGWIRTNVGVSQQIYSLPPLATRAPLRGEPQTISEFLRALSGVARLAPKRLAELGEVVQIAGQILQA